MNIYIYIYIYRQKSFLITFVVLIYICIYDIDRYTNLHVELNLLIIDRITFIKREKEQ